MIAGRIIFYYRVCTPKNWSHPDPDTVINRVYWLDGCGIIRRAIWSPADMRMMEFPVDTLLTIHSGDGPESMVDTAIYRDPANPVIIRDSVS